MKKVYLLLIAALATSAAYSQAFMHGAGLATLINSAPGSHATAQGFTYSPRINFFETEALSLSAGIPFSFGLSASYGIKYNFTDGGSTSSSVGFIFNAPLIINLNFGRGSTKQNRDKKGYFVGAGFGYHYSAFQSGLYTFYSDTYKISTNYYGPAANAGVRFGVGKRHKNIEARLSYMKGLNENKVNVFGLACLFNF